MKTEDASRSPASQPSLPEVHGSVAVPSGGSLFRRLLAFAGPAYLVSVGYMDPGNWATDIAGGSRFGYRLIWVLLLSNAMAIILQTLAARLGVVTGKDLAQACRDFYPRAVSIPLWALCELAIVACDLAEVLGSAIGMKLLFGIPLLWGVFITALDVMVLLGLSRLGMRRMEAFIVALVATVGICFGIEIVLSKPEFAAIFSSIVPRGDDGAPSLFGRGPDGGFSVLGLHGESLYIAIGILGATVMPHNLYLHSSLVQTRVVGGSPEAKRTACRMNMIDSIVALNCALFVNAAILILAGAAFHKSGHQEVGSLEEAHELLSPLLGSTLAPILFAVALLCAGQSSTITGTLAGQVVMEGFLRIRIRPWIRRMISRALAIVPAALVIALQGEAAVDGLLVLSQVVLSLQLSFAVIPLLYFTSDRSRMGRFANPPWAIALAGAVALLILGLNGKLAKDAISGWIESAGSGAIWVQVLVFPVVGALGGLLFYLILAPFLRSFAPRLLAPPAEIPISLVLPPATPEIPVAAHPSGYRRIAVALEIGPADPPVLEHVWRLAQATGAELVLIHVAESAASRYLGELSSDEEARGDKKALDDLARQFRERGIAVSVLLGHGQAPTELARLVQFSGADILVAGSHGHRMLQDLILGTTVSGVRHRLSIPVLTVPAREPAAA